MARYRIVCTTQVPCAVANAPAHVARVGTGIDPARADIRWTLVQVLRAMQEGDTFYTEGIITGKQAEVEAYECTRCKQTCIRSAADSVPDNNLESLQPCHWY